MISKWMMLSLIAFYGCLSIVSMWERRPSQALYWLSAAQITASVILMQGGYR